MQHVLQAYNRDVGIVADSLRKEDALPSFGLEQGVQYHLQLTVRSLRISGDPRCWKEL